MNRGYVYVLLCYFLIGISYPVAKEAMNQVPIWLFTSLTFAMAFVMLMPFARFVDKARLRAIGLRVWLAVSVQSLLGAMLYTVFLLYGLESASAIMAALFTSLAPALVLSLSSLLLKERLTLRKLLAITLAVAGILVLTLPAADGGHTTWLGVGFLLLSTLCTAISVIAANRLDVTLPPITLSAGVCLTGCLFSLPMALGQAATFDWHGLGASTWWVMVYYAALVWAAPYVLFFMGVTRIPASATGMAIAVVPLAATFFAIAFYGETLHLSDTIALLLVTISIIAAESSPLATADTAQTT
ncbi:DMT family transporter [Pseudomonas sp. 148P]|uniref:DMT family transporter n=1 Tax=Pseudomonas ulcerans TaxID=3115852 RepID=A0ABU7HTC3_9PSED|nr:MULTISPECIES: DMT family transporter [unclassified Pseudomonas]MEE1923332.1 DMT family transporter [Pseudomonas sp. 147P]MEE1934792.1 DMT family transporter [Pseudomonas sp. 148P]